MRKAKSLLVILATLLLGECAWGIDIPLTVEEPVGVARQRAPVSSGICFPRRAVRANQPLRLLDGDTEIPLQSTPLVVDRDGSLRWVLLDFQMDIGAKETKRLLLRTQAGGGRALKGKEQRVGLQIIENETAVTVNTGPLTWVVSKVKPFILFDSVWVRGTKVITGGAVDFIEGKTGQLYTAGKPRRVAFEYRGPLRATLRVEGVYEGAGDCHLQYITRITTWAGRTDVRVQHILANSNSEQVYHANIRRAALTLRHAFGAKAEAFVGSGGVSAKLANDTTVWLHQGKVNRYYNAPVADATKAGINEETTWAGADSGGWVAVRQAGGAFPLTLLVCDRDFLGDPPRKLVADPKHVTIEFVSSKFSEGRGVPFRSDYFWLYDLSHKVADVYIDFAAGNLDAQALAARARLMAFAPGEWYAQCDVFGVGPFGTLEDEKKVYQQWGWKFDEKQLPRREPAPNAFVRWEDNHYESEADSTEALLLMAIRTGQRGFFDWGEAWARYHANLHAWRTDGWVYDDGAIWFPQGGPLGTRPARRPANIQYQAWGRGTGDDQELWHLVQAKSCYCHFYGAGLVDCFLLTGEKDFLEAAVDLAEQKNSEFRKHWQFTPGKTTIHETRGFGRGFYVITHLLEVLPDNVFLQDLARLCRDVLWQCPNLDERGFAPSHIGTGFGGFNLKRDLPTEMRAFMEKEGITIDEKGWLTDRIGKRWPVVCLGGTWQHFYVQAAAERYARLFHDEDMADFTDAFGRFAAKFLLSEKCKQTPYYAYMDVPQKGQAWDPWQFVPPHTTTKEGEGCEHSGYYTRFFPDAMAKAYTLTGDRALLLRAREFWHYGSKRGYRTMRLSCGWDAVGAFATHVPPKDDSILSTSRMFYEWAHPRKDTQPPKAINDLRVTLIGDGKALIRFTAPADVGGGRVVRYQVKCADLPIVAYEDYDFARDDGVKRNFWRATNLTGEPLPAAAGRQEEFVVSGVPNVPVLYFVVVSDDDSNNRSGLSNVVKVSAFRSSAFSPLPIPRTCGKSRVLVRGCRQGC